MKNRQNTFLAFLDLLKVKHTVDFSNRYYNEHPHKNNLFGLSKMLSDYGVENAGTRIADKENDLPRIECPFVAHLSADFVTVYKVELPLNPLKGTSNPHSTDLQDNSNIPLQGAGGSVHYLWNGKKIILPIAKFIKAWSGIILLAETTPRSGEPDYQEHRKKELFGFAQKSMIAFAIIFIFGISYFNQLSVIPLFSNSIIPLFKHSVIPSFSYSILLFLNLLGIYTGYLLVLKQMHIHSQYADKICSLFSKSDCNNVLESDAAKLWGVFGWSEIGLGYFTANVLLILYLPFTIYYLAIIHIFTLPYSFWSVWYQKVKARQWCPLCLIVQVLLWSIFVANIIFGYIQIQSFSYSIIQSFSYSIIQLLFIGCAYAVCIFGFNLLIPALSRGGEMEQAHQEINAIKANEDVFRTLLTQQPKYEVSPADSQICFGTPDAKMVISILTNPFCNPCAKMHKRVMQFLHDTNQKARVQYLFSSFNSELEFANKYLIAVYLKNSHCELDSQESPCHCGLDPQSPDNPCHCGLDPQSPEQIFTDWFEKGKPLKEAFFRDMQLDISDPSVEAEFQKHEAWKEKTQLRATPTILVNGYKLPENYKIEDLRYFMEFETEPPVIESGAKQSKNEEFNVDAK